MPYDNPQHIPYGDMEILTAARDRIAHRDHWGQSRFQDGERCCLLEALRWAREVYGKLDDPSGEAEQRLYMLLLAQLPRKAGIRTRMKFIPPRYRLMIFNNSLTTYHDDVIELLNRTIRHLESAALNPSHV